MHVIIFSLLVTGALNYWWSCFRGGAPIAVTVHRYRGHTTIAKMLIDARANLDQSNKNVSAFFGISLSNSSFVRVIDVFDFWCLCDAG